MSHLGHRTYLVGDCFLLIHKIYLLLLAHDRGVGSALENISFENIKRIIKNDIEIFIYTLTFISYDLTS